MAEDTKRRHIAVICCSLTGCQRLRMRLSVMGVVSRHSDWAWTFIDVAGVTDNVHARNKAVGKLFEAMDTSLRVGAPPLTETLWIDDDVDIEADRLDTLLMHDEADLQTSFTPVPCPKAHLVTGFYPLAKGGPLTGVQVEFEMAAYSSYDPATQDTTSWFPSPNDPPSVPLVAAGFGLIRVKTAVFADHSMWLPGSTQEKPVLFQWRTNPQGQRIQGEDFDFCQRAIAAGYKLVGLTNVVAEHYKVLPLTKVINLVERAYAAGYCQAADERSAASVDKESDHGQNTPGGAKEVELEDTNSAQERSSG